VILPSAIAHLRNYASAGFVVALAGLITFPLLTRSLTVAEYGILGLATSGLTFFIAVGKLGAQHAVIRFFSQIKNRNLGYSLQQMNSTVFTLFFSLAVLTSIIWLGLGYAVFPSVIDHDHTPTLLTAAAGVIFFRMLGSGVLNFLRAQQRSGVVASAMLIMRCLYVAWVVAFITLTSVSPHHVLIAMILAELVGLVFLMRQYWPSFHFSVNDISSPLAKAMLAYGLPLMMLESLGLILRLSDRFLIGALLDEDTLGMYSASYNFTAYLDLIILASLAQAIKPMYMEMWESSGSKQTRAFLSRGLQLFLIIGIPFVAIFSLVGPHLLNFLASPKYAPGTVVIPFVALSYLLEGSTHFLAAGLYIKKNTKGLMVWGAIAAVINIALNLIVIPKYGIVGAAVVTVISYAIFMFGVCRQAFKHVPLTINLKVPALLMVISVIIYWLGHEVFYANDVATFFQPLTSVGVAARGG